MPTIVRLYRWQTNTSRYQKQEIELDANQPLADHLFNAGSAPATLRDITIKQTIMRTQHVDRISIEQVQDEMETGHVDTTVVVNIFLSPTMVYKLRKENQPRKKCRTELDRKVAQDVYRPLEHSNASRSHSKCECDCVQCQLASDRISGSVMSHCGSEACKYGHLGIQVSKCNCACLSCDIGAHDCCATGRCEFTGKDANL